MTNLARCRLCGEMPLYFEGDEYIHDEHVTHPDNDCILVPHDDALTMSIEEWQSLHSLQSLVERVDKLGARLNIQYYKSDRFARSIVVNNGEIKIYNLLGHDTTEYKTLDDALQALERDKGNE